jgi:hypothetical protein
MDTGRDSRFATENFGRDCKILTKFSVSKNEKIFASPQLEASSNLAITSLPSIVRKLLPTEFFGVLQPPASTSADSGYGVVGHHRKTEEAHPATDRVSHRVETGIG